MAFILGREGQHISILQSCVFVCLCRLLRNSVLDCVHPCQEFDYLLAVPFTYAARQLGNRPLTYKDYGFRAYEVMIIKVPRATWAQAYTG